MKFLGAFTRILMSNGSIKSIEELNVGDLIMGDDGKGKLVKQIRYNESGEMCRVIPRHGESYVISNETQFICRHNVNDLWCFMSLNTFKGLNLLQRQNIGLLRMSCAFNKIDIYIEPYLLGIWLCKAYKNNEQSNLYDSKDSQFFSSDIEIDLNDLNECIIEHINNILGKYRLNHNFNDEGNILIITDKRLKFWFKMYGLRTYRHIPEDYKCNLIDIRLKLLAGILDSIGISDYNKQCYDIIDSDFQIIKDLRYICHSVGLQTILKQKHNSYILSLFGSGILNIPIQNITTNILYSADISCDIKIAPIIDTKQYGILVEDNKIVLEDFTIL